MRVFTVFIVSVITSSYLISCATVKPDEPMKSPQFRRCIIESVSVGGLVYWDERPVGRVEAVAFGSSYQTFSGRGSGSTTGVVGGRVLSAQNTGHYSGSGTGFASASGRTNMFENFENTTVQEALKQALEDSGFTKRITSRSAARVEGVIVDLQPRLLFGKVAWNVFHTATLLLMFGTPYLGTVDAEVELRFYGNDELIAKAKGYGRADWAQHGYKWFQEIKSRAKAVALEMAMLDALEKLVFDPILNP